MLIGLTDLLRLLGAISTLAVKQYIQDCLSKLCVANYSGLSVISNVHILHFASLYKTAAAICSFGRSAKSTPLQLFPSWKQLDIALLQIQLVYT